jgi:hypothetical protein
MTSPLVRNSSVGLAIGALAGALTCALLASIAWSADRPDFARGIVWGGSFSIVGVIVLKILSHTRFASAEARLASGKADEREKGLAVRSLATASLTMYGAAIISAFATMYGLEPQASLAIIMFTGLITATASFAILARRG